MHSWEAIEISLNYIEEHLAENLLTEHLADMVGLSSFYYQRLFKRLVRTPVQEYIKLRRLEHSIEMLNIPEKRILDVALDSGYSSHANYTRAFKESFGITPQEYRIHRPTLNSFIKPEISMNYTVVDECVPLIAGNIVLEVERRTQSKEEKYLGFEATISMSGQIPAGEKTGVDMPGELWKKFHARKRQMCDYYPNNIELGVSHSPNSKTDTFLYFAGGLTSNSEAVTYTDMTYYSLKPGEYVVCRIEADSFEFLVANALYQANKYVFGIWLPKHNLTSKPLCAEKYFEENAEVYSMELWIQTNEIKR